MKSVILSTCIAVSIVQAGCNISTVSEIERCSIVNLIEHADAADTGDFDEIFSTVWAISPEVTDSTLLSYANIAGLDDGKLYLHQRDDMMIFDTADGHCISSFNRSGQGPGEYVRAWNAWKTIGEQGWTVYDLHNNRILTYDIYGTKRSTYPLKENYSRILPSGKSWYGVGEILGIIPEENNRDIEFYQFSTSWTLTDSIRSSFEPMLLDGGRINIPMPTYPGYNDNFYCLANDTLFDVSSSHGVKPVIAFNTGDASMPIVDTYEEYGSNMESGRYIDLFRAVSNGNHVITLYRFKNRLLSQIYHLPDGKLLYSRSVADVDDASQFGFPLSFNGIKTYGFVIDFIDRDGFIMYVSPDNMSDATGDEDSNPAFVKVKAK
ncbi:MAG: 6-bladed beta-propeller [Clostridiales bacterium]|nr:6-bladed beta-propeller [Clostridiales bacterium]